LPEICYRYSVKDAAPEDFLLAVDPARLVLEDKTVREAGRDISCDIYDADGILTTRITFEYDEAGRLIRQLDYVGEFNTPFKEETRTYSASGKLLSVEVNFEGEPDTLETHHYDHLDRLIEVIEKHFDDEESFEVRRYHYTDTSDHHATEELYLGDELMSVIRSSYDAQGRLTEEQHEVPNDEYAAIILRYYPDGNAPNNVVWEKYNHRGTFLEQCREWYDPKGNLVKRTLHTDDAAHSNAYYVELHEYTASGFRTRETHFRNNAVVKEERLLPDDKRRVLRTMNSEANHYIMICHRYETNE
jgi:YD repeat-containing protein